MADPYELAMSRWRRKSVQLLPPVSAAEMARIFGELNQPISEDVLRLYTTTRGFIDGESDCVWSLWSLDRVVREYRESQFRRLWFADFLIDSHRYFFQYQKPEKSAVFIDHFSAETPPYEIAESVEQFLVKYVADPGNVEAPEFE